jgi:hypothetical protein
VKNTRTVKANNPPPKQPRPKIANPFAEYFQTFGQVADTTGYPIPSFLTGRERAQNKKK